MLARDTLHNLSRDTHLPLAKSLPQISHFPDLLSFSPYLLLPCLQCVAFMWARRADLRADVDIRQKQMGPVDLT